MSRLGIIAGSGVLPRLLIEDCLGRGQEVFVLALKGHADPAILTDVPHVWIGLGEAAAGFGALSDNDVAEVVMIGRVRRPSLRELKPDWRAAKLLARAGARAFGDDGLLSALIGEIEAEGYRVRGIEEVLSGLLAPPGVWGRYAPDAEATADIARGFAVARGIGSLDVGQGCVVQGGLVLAVEAIEGTDAMLARCGGLKRDGPGGVLVKAKKPQQERRADLPTIGVQTVEQAAGAGLRGIAVEAMQTLAVDRPGIVAAADRLGLFVCGET